MTLRQPNIERMLQLGLQGMADAMDDLQRVPDADQLGFDDRLAMLLERELSHRNQRSYLAHLRRAQLHVQADVQDVDCREGRGISRTLLTQLATGEWIRNAHHLCIGGKTGVGKTFLICALAHQACMQRLSVLYRRVPDLMAELADTRGTPRHPRLLRRLERLDLLCLDDWGLHSFSSEERRDVLEIVERRYRRKSLLIGSQIPAELWHSMLGEPTLADAILDRIVHNAYHIELDGESKRREVHLPPLDGLATVPSQARESPARHAPGASGALEPGDNRAMRAGKQA